jgi:hypothetical protein
MDVKVDTVLRPKPEVSAIGGTETAGDIFLFNDIIRWLQI